MNSFNWRILYKKCIESIFKNFGLLTIIFACCCLVIILFAIVSKGYKAFYNNYLSVNITLTSNISPNISWEDRNTYIENLLNNSFNTLIKKHELEPVTPSNILSNNYYQTIFAYIIKHKLTKNDSFNIDLLLNSDPDMFLKHNKQELEILTTEQQHFLNFAKQNHLIKTKFNFRFFSNSDSRYAEQAGINGALKGTIATISLTLIFSFIIGITTAVYLENFTKPNNFKAFIEVNINNLAAVPSIIFGLLGLVLFQNLLDIPRSSPLLAALVLSLMILPTIIISSQLALRSTPRSIIEAAYGLGASKNQVIFSHIFPFALPGILTGIIIGIARAVGETAPLLIIGMFAFISNNSFSIFASATTLPAQILMWSNLPEIGYKEKASATIMVLLFIMICFNIAASFIRKKLEKKL
ncbi:phosphate ABC transporter permease PstA [Rickettsiales bacterium LUAb2]